MVDDMRRDDRGTDKPRNLLKVAQPRRDGVRILIKYFGSRNQVLKY